MFVMQKETDVGEESIDSLMHKYMSPSYHTGPTNNNVNK